MAEGQKYVNLLSDAGFKAVFCDVRNKRVLIDFLNLVLRGERVVTDLEYMNTEVFGQTVESRFVRFDLSCIDSAGVRFVVEMQRTRHDRDFYERSVFYGTIVYELQSESYRPSYVCPPAYVIGIMEGHLAHEKWSDSCISRYKFADVDKNIAGPETFSLIFVQLGFFRKEKEECVEVFDQWLYCLKHMWEMDDLPESFACDGGLASLRDASEIAAFDESKLINYTAQEMTERDYQHDLYYSRLEGREEGREEGKKSVVLAMLKNGMPIQQVVQYSGLTEEQVLALSNEK